MRNVECRVPTPTFTPVSMDIFIEIDFKYRFDLWMTRALLLNALYDYCYFQFRFLSGDAGDRYQNMCKSQGNW